MPFTPIQTDIPQRSPELLEFPAPDATPEEAKLAGYNIVAPGLYPGETVMQLDTGENVAVSVARVRKPNGGGMDFRAWARLITEDGSTVRDPAGQEMEMEYPFGPDAGVLEAAAEGELPGEAVVARELTLLVLGEELTLKDVLVDEGQDPVQAPIFGWDAETRLNASIRHAITLAAATTDQVDVGALFQV